LYPIDLFFLAELAAEFIFLLQI